MTDLVDQLRDVAHLAGHAAPVPPFEDLKTRARLRQQQRIGAVVAAAAAIVGLVVAAAALVWPTPSAPPADRPRPAKVDDERLLRRGDFVQPGFQAVEDVTGRAGHPACAGTSSGPRRTAQWREFRTFDIDARGYQVVLSYTDAAAARRGVRAVEACPVMVTGATTLTSALTDLRGDEWQVRRLPARPDHPEVFAVARVGNVVAAVWVLGLHRVVATDGYAQGLLDRMRARLNGTSTRGVTPPPDALTAALVTKADAAALTGRSRIKVEYPAVYRSVHTCQPVPRSVIEWRHVQYQRHDWQPLLDERISIVTDVAAAARSWRQLVTDITGCAATTERIMSRPPFGDDAVLITDADDPASPTVVVRVGRVLVELVLWRDSRQRPGISPDVADAFITAAIHRIRDRLPQETAATGT